LRAVPEGNTEPQPSRAAKPLKKVCQGKKAKRRDDPNVEATLNTEAPPKTLDAPSLFL
jgi:hypothetical protein